MARVLVTQAVAPSAIELLERAGHRVDERRTATPIARPELLARVVGCRGLMAMPTDRIDAEILEAGPLAVVANHAVGVDNIDLPAARLGDVVVTNTPGVLTVPTAELTMALMLAVARRLVEADRFVRQGRFVGWGPQLMCGAGLAGAVLGIVGLGRIGRAVAERATAFGMRVVHTSRSSGLPLGELLATADVVSLHCPLDERTRHLIGGPELDRMKPAAMLINTARGPVVDETALAHALSAGRLAGAGLDVFENEPAVHEALLGLPNVVLLPHIGSATAQCRTLMGELAARNIIEVLAGRVPRSPVD